MFDMLMVVVLASLSVDGWSGSLMSVQPGRYRPPADPGPSDVCPSDMRLVERDHYDHLERLCLDEHNNRCWSFVPFADVRDGEKKHLRFCMDQYEAPNEREAKPLVMRTFLQAKQWCEQRGKRLCSEQEFESACEGDAVQPFFYGWQVDREVCNSNKSWRPFDSRALEAGGERARREAERLWQGARSGQFQRCRTPDGIYDLLGNVEEWVTSRKGRRWAGALMGGFWAKPWTGCRGTNDAHQPSFRFYEVGWRCCKDPSKPVEGR